MSVLFGMGLGLVLPAAGVAAGGSGFAAVWQIAVVIEGTPEGARRKPTHVVETARRVFGACRSLAAGAHRPVSQAWRFTRRRYRRMLGPMSDSFFQPVSGFRLPRFAGIPTFMRLPHVPPGHPRRAEVELGFVGVPWDAGTTNRPGPATGRASCAMPRR